MFKKIGHLFQAFAFLLLLGFARLLPISWSSRLGGLITRGLRYVLKERALGIDNLSLAFPDMSTETKEKISKAVWDNVGKTGIEFLAIDKIAKNFEKHVDIEGLSHLAASRETGRPILALSGHFANWNITLMTAMRELGNAIAIYRPVNNPYLDRIIRKQYQIISPRSLAKGESVSKMAQALREGATIAMLADQHMSGGIEVEFFGQKVLAPAGPAMLSLRVGADLLPFHCRRDMEADVQPHYTVSIGAPFVSHKDSKKEQIIDLTQQYYSYLEDEIRKCPESWLWLHARFSKYNPQKKELH